MTWESLAAGDGCSFDAPRPGATDHWDELATLRVSTAYLPHNQTYRGHCVLVFDPRHAVRPDQLSAAEWGAFCADAQQAVRAIMQVCAADHINVASLGNVMPHLHWHVVPRYKDDGRWGAPIWSADASAEPNRHLPADDRAALLRTLRAALG